MTQSKHKHYDLAYRAHYNTSFSPDKRAAMQCEWFDDAHAKLVDLDVPVEKIAKWESLWIKWMCAKSRCLSSMITGPANFPVRRNEKANNAERNAGENCLNYYQTLVNYAKKEKYYASNPEARPIMAADADAPERLKQQIEARKAKQEQMKAHNAGLRKGEVHGLKRYAPFELTNNLANIKRLEQRLADLEKKKETGTKEIEIAGVKVVQNAEDMRLQLFFDGKPKAEIIALLKKHAFKWAPSKGAWQRQLTNNALYSFKQYVAPVLKQGAA